MKDTMKKVDEAIEAICEWVKKEIEVECVGIDPSALTEIIKNLAGLIDARGKIEGSTHSDLCEKCKEENKIFEILNILRWRVGGNYLSALASEKETKCILVNKDSLMRAIQLANPGQAYRDIRLISHDEYRKIQYKESELTSNVKKAGKENG